MVVPRPVKPENACLLKLPNRILFGRPPESYAFFRAAFRSFSTNARWVALSTRRLVPSAAVGSAPVPPPLMVLVLIHDNTSASFGAVEELPVTLAWLAPVRIDSISR